ncbi:hypothetical protein D0864_02614 [Hortaea werneckii]|uniref:C2H2-type domain-containing protein n=1 Tax=Hortaea werneckii TaxID=91943 RepID=A0A3M7GV00_HORWE|nr:hypothetical protein KC323_g2283 [Hortaea werneckii]KAI7354988.1 hypothetical protein KC320_g3098 [Hortaea werneckii]KAI7645199.1 hypothetical protein KC319_g12090 [Hortaea werneckii]KAI7687613.1 hypothetical protein KC322_g12372 [Hortaea werneckii]RMY99239.1 hypothetical protein D0862_07204 [Hortaea werneckii]
MSWPEDDQPCFSTEHLQPVGRPRLDIESSSKLSDKPVEPVTFESTASREFDPGLAAVLSALAPTYPELAERQAQMISSGSPTSVQAPDEEPGAANGSVSDGKAGTRALPKAIERHDSGNVCFEEMTRLSPRRLAATATAVIASSEPSDQELKPAEEITESQSSRADHSSETLSLRPATRAETNPPLNTQTSCSEAPVPGMVHGSAISPTVDRHFFSTGQPTVDTLPAVQTVPKPDQGEPHSPRKERLPSFSQFTGQLNELAEAAATREPQQPFGHRHTQSFGSATSQSSAVAYSTPAFARRPSIQTSPVSNYAQSIRSPTNTVNDSSQAVYGSPQQYAAPLAYFSHRRLSNTHDGTTSMYPASLPSAGTSSSESHGHPGSSTDGYSTTHTTPIDQPPTIDGNPRPILPPPPGMPGSIMMGFKCDYSGCTAPPFQTQYLLTSHKNVHSSNRPHYCSVNGCPRSEGGKGFKRKNEMIRHGLVHSSPGYICPFCPERDHKYPRPDNLQRHVRVHHQDRDRDDPALREVLAQRQEGIGKQRRRRTNATGNVT